MSSPKHARINDKHAADDHAAGHVVIEHYTDHEFPEHNWASVYRPHPYDPVHPTWEEIATIWEEITA